MTSLVSSEYVKNIIIDTRNSDKITAPDNMSSFGTNLTSTGVEIANEFLGSFHIIFFLSSILVFVAIIPATLKDRHPTT